MPVTPCTRATAPSMVEVIWRSTVSADAPMKVVLMVRTGWSTRGSSRSSTPRKAARPPTTSSALMTTASTGRRTKRPASFAPWAFWAWLDIGAVPSALGSRGAGRGRALSLVPGTPAGRGRARLAGLGRLGCLRALPRCSLSTTAGRRRGRLSTASGRPLVQQAHRHVVRELQHALRHHGIARLDVAGHENAIGIALHDLDHPLDGLVVHDLPHIGAGI